VGAQPTVGFEVNFVEMAKSCGYNEAFTVSTPEEIKEGMRKLRNAKGPAFLEVRIKPGARRDLGRPKQGTLQAKNSFMKFLQQ